MQIPGTDLEASEVIMGNFRIGFLPEKSQHEAYLNAALEAGINYFDHSDSYGSRNPKGRSDEQFARVIDLRSSLRDQLIIQTKVGSVFRDIDGERVGVHDLSREHILESVEGSLRRLNTDRIDVLLNHRPDPLMEPEEVAAAFDELHASGKVRYFGVSNMSPTRMDLLRKYVKQPLVIHQLHVSLVDPSAIDFTTDMPPFGGPVLTHDPTGGVLDYSRLHDMQIQAWSPLTYESNVQRRNNPGRPHPWVPFVDDYVQFGPLNTKLDEIGERYGIGKLGVVCAWLLTHPARMMPVIGTSNPARVKEAASGMGVRLSRDEWFDLYRLTATGLV